MNTPNKITLARICLIPLVIFFYLANFIPWGKFIAGMIFVIASLTDFLDGYLARKNNQVTNLGKFLDPIADKILVMAALLLVIAYPIVSTAEGFVCIVRPQWVGVLCVIIILARDFVISTLRQVAATKGKVLHAEKSGKIKTTVQDITLALYFFYAFYVTEFYVMDVKGHETANAVIGIILLALLVLSTILTITSGIGYMVKNRHVFVDEGKAEGNQVLFVANEVKPEKAKPTSSKATSQKQKQYDVLIPQAMEMFWEKGWASTTMLQKSLAVGYPRASKMVSQMEELGLISPLENNKTRRILVSREEFDKNYSHLK